MPTWTWFFRPTSLGFCSSSSELSVQIISSLLWSFVGSCFIWITKKDAVGLELIALLFRIQWTPSNTRLFWKALYYSQYVEALWGEARILCCKYPAYLQQFVSEDIFQLCSFITNCQKSSRIYQNDLIYEKQQNYKSFDIPRTFIPRQTA